MKIHYYEIKLERSSLTVSNLLDSLRRQPQVQRERRIHDKDVFLEQGSSKDGLWELEFTQRRIHNGPGYSVKGKPTTDFNLAQGAGFGEQAAAIWSPRGFLAVQYNHHGVRPSGIRAYLERFLRDYHPSTNTPPKVALNPVIDQEAFARLIRSQRHLRLECTIAVDALTEDLASGDVSLQAFLQLRNQTSAGKVEIALSYGQGKRGGPLDNILKTVQSLLRCENHLSKLKATVKEDLDAVSEVLDLLEHRETALVPDSELTVTSGMRYTYSSRVEAIRNRFEPWLAQRTAVTAAGIP